MKHFTKYNKIKNICLVFLIIVPLYTQGSEKNTPETAVHKNESWKNFLRNKVLSLFDRKNLLHKAVKAGNIKELKRLIGLGVDVNLQDEDGNTALHLAVLEKNKPMLLRLMYEENLNFGIKNKGKWTPLHLAIMHKQTEIAESLIDGIVWSAKTFLSDEGTEKLYKEKLAVLDIKGGYSDGTVLHLALQNEEMDIFELLLKKGANPNVKDRNSNNILHLVIQGGLIEFIPDVIKAGADPNMKDGNDKSPLYLVIQNEKLTAVIPDLISAGADPNEEDKNGNSLLYLTLQSGEMEIFELLLKKRANPTGKDEEGNSILHLLIQKGLTEFVPDVINAKADLNIQNNELWTPLHLAAWMGDVKSARALIRAGAKLNMGEIQAHATPLDLAKIQNQKQNENREMIDLLRKNRAYGNMGPIGIFIGKISNPSTCKNAFKD